MLIARALSSKTRDQLSTTEKGAKTPGCGFEKTEKSDTRERDLRGRRKCNSDAQRN